jgi:hypothetical protein
MHPEVINFVSVVRRKFPDYFVANKVLEVGSLDLNGSVRQFFDSCEYIGIDIGEGKGVDLVVPMHEYKKPGEFDVVITTEMLEHDQHWQDSLIQMYENLRSGGLLILTCASLGRAEHGTIRTSPSDSPFTTDYYRNISPTDFLTVLPSELFKTSFIDVQRGFQDLVFWGVKK